MRGAIVGFGKIAETTHVAALAAAGLEVAAVVETNPLRRDVAARCLPAAKLFADLATLLDQAPLEFVDVCTPPHLHFELVSMAARLGLHVLCEKPLVLDLSQAEQLLQIAATQPIAIACVHNWTQAPIWQRAQELLRSLGPLRSVHLATLRTEPAATAVGNGDNWRVDPSKAGGGILFDHGWHAMSILLRLFASAPLTVKARLERRGAFELPVEDTAAVDIGFACGGRAQVHLTWAASERCNRARLEASNGVIEIENDRLTLRHDRGVDHEHFTESLAAGGYRPTWTGGIIREWIAEMSNPATRGHLLKEAVFCLRLLRAAYQSHDQEIRL